MPSLQAQVLIHSITKHKSTFLSTLPSSWRKHTQNLKRSVSRSALSFICCFARAIVGLLGAFLPRQIFDHPPILPQKLLLLNKPKWYHENPFCKAWQSEVRCSLILSMRFLFQHQRIQIVLPLANNQQPLPMPIPLALPIKICLYPWGPNLEEPLCPLPAGFQTPTMPLMEILNKHKHS